MSPKNPLTVDQIMEVVLLRKRGWTAEAIAPKFDRSVTAIEHILEGRTYQDVTGRVHVRSEKCRCPRCVDAFRAQANLDIADAAECTAQCRCGAEVVRKVVAVQRTHGHVLCDSCDGRRH